MTRKSQQTRPKGPASQPVYMSIVHNQVVSVHIDMGYYGDLSKVRDYVNDCDPVLNFLYFDVL